MEDLVVAKLMLWGAVFFTSFIFFYYYLTRKVYQRGLSAQEIGTRRLSKEIKAFVLMIFLLGWILLGYKWISG